MERIEKNERMVMKAAMQGSVSLMERLLEEDEVLLDRFVSGCHPETPLHVAAMLGREEFTKEILRRKPELAGELDFRRSSPLHLAAANGHLQVVKSLLAKNPDMCLALDRDGRNPLHIAVIKGRVEILEELVQAKPEAAHQVRMAQGQTILHLCVNHCRLEALMILINTINNHEFVNSTGDDNFTVLHLAVALAQIESVNFLIKETPINVNAVDCNGLTALDMALAGNQRNQKIKDIRECLKCAGASRAHQDTSLLMSAGSELVSTSNGDHRPYQSPIREKQRSSRPRRDKWLDNKRNTLMVVASLIATMAFQAGINPPGGVWQDDYYSNRDHNQTSEDHSAGFSILADKSTLRYAQFQSYNSTGFLASLSVILLLISGLPFKCRFFMWILMVIMWVAVISMVLAYSVSVYSLTPDDIKGILAEQTWIYFVLPIPTIACFCLMGFLLLGHTIRLTIKMARFARRLMMKKRQPSNLVLHASV